MAEYLVLIFGDERSIDSGGQALADQLMAEHGTFGATNRSALRGGNALQPEVTAKSIRKSADGTVTVSDGPFTGGSEALGGYYLIEASGPTEALSIAAQVPAPFGGVEVRPVMVFD